MKRIFSLLAFAALFSSLACTQAPNPGGTEFGNPAPIPTTSVSGALSPPQAPQGTILAMASPCGADTVLATDGGGQTTNAAVQADCKFAITVPSGKAYELRFESEGKFVARLVVATPSPFFPQFSFFLPTSVSAINLGSVKISANQAIPDNSPLNQTDRDGDGLVDATDTDDDNDAVLDTDEKDCDLDGFLDDDDTNSTCTPLGALKAVLQATPFNGETGVGLNEVPKVRFACPVNAALLTPSHFILKKVGDPPILCSFGFSADFTRVDCAHSANPFQPNSVYEGILQEIECQDGSKTQAITWSWTTGP